jgi:hypothetical protein
VLHRQQALHNYAWIQAIRITDLITVQHMAEFVDACLDQIQWKFTPRRRVFDQVGILGTIPCSMGTALDTLIWKRWAPPKCKFFAWLAFQNQLWTADRMEKRGWPNQRVCPLCREANESALHLLAHCRYSNRIWRAIRQSTAGHFPVVEGWDQFTSISHWCQVIYWKDSWCTYPRVRSLILVVAWEIWNERNARIFQQKFKPPERLIEMIKAEAITWCLAGAKHLKEIVSEPVARGSCSLPSAFSLFDRCLFLFFLQPLTLLYQYMPWQ